MSFIDLYSNTIWTETDISNKVQSIIRSQFSAEDELKASRLSRQSKPSASDMEYINMVDSAIQSAIDQGRAARSDNQLLIQVIDYETAVLRLRRPEEPEFILDQDENEIPNPLYEMDQEQRLAAQTVVDAVSTEVIELADQRNNLVEPIIEPVVDESQDSNK